MGTFKHDISAQNEGTHVLAISIFQNFLGEHATESLVWGDACGITNNYLPTLLPTNQLGAL